MPPFVYKLNKSLAGIPKGGNTGGNGRQREATRESRVKSQRVNESMSQKSRVKESKVKESMVKSQRVNKSLLIGVTR